MTKYKIVSAREATPREATEAKRLQELVHAQLPAIRATAENWRNGVGLATILAGAASALAAPEVLAKASKQQVADGAWFLAIGALIAVVALALAMRASFGWPRAVLVSSSDSLDAWEQREVTWTVVYLRVSMVLSVIALVAMGTAAAVLLFNVPIPWHFEKW